MTVYQAMIPLNPKTKKNNQEILFKHNGTRNGFYLRTNGVFRFMGIPFISQSKAYKQYEADAGWYLKKTDEPIDYPVNIKCLFYRKSAIRCDQTNLLEAIDDILVKYGVIKDDNFKIIAGHDGSRVYIDKENPRTEIYIEKMEELEWKTEA